jgi:hypothetical protein
LPPGIGGPRGQANDHWIEWPRVCLAETANETGLTGQHPRRFCHGEGANVRPGASAWARGTSPAQGKALSAGDKIDELRPRLE